MGEEFMPKVIDKIPEVYVPMSEHQYWTYSGIRVEERKSEFKKTKKKTEEERKLNIFKKKDSYRAISRMCCSFTFPNDIPRPRFKDIELEEEDELEKSNETKEVKNKKRIIINKKKVEIYQQQKRSALRELSDKKGYYLCKGTVDVPGMLYKLSPKYVKVLENLEKNPGLSFIYSEYRNLEGIAVFSLVLEANGYAKFDVKKNDDNKWVLDINEDDMDKPKYIVWGGKKDKAKDDLLLKIFNNDFTYLDKVSEPLQEYLDTRDNLRGGVAKIFMTTQTGAEGITLQNVRQVHILEPYWNYGRLEQIKGRAVRACSHNTLPKNERDVSIFIYLSTFTKKQRKNAGDNGLTTDEYLYDISNKKKKVIDELFQILKDSALDCRIHKKDNMTAKQPIDCFKTDKDYYKDGYVYMPNLNTDIKDEGRTKRQKKKIVKTQEKLKKLPINVKGIDDKYLINTTTKDIFLQVLKSGKVIKGRKVGVFNTETKKPRFLKWYTQKIREARK